MKFSKKSKCFESIISKFELRLLSSWFTALNNAHSSAFYCIFLLSNGTDNEKLTQFNVSN